MPPGNLCAVEGCRSSKQRNKDLSFFQLPVDEERRKKWAQLIGRHELASPSTKPKSHYVCSLHFKKSMIIYKPQLRPDALPAKLLPPPPNTLNILTEIETKEVSTQTSNSKVIIMKSADTEVESRKTFNRSKTKRKTPVTSSVKQEQRTRSEGVKESKRKDYPETNSSECN